MFTNESPVIIDPRAGMIGVNSSHMLRQSTPSSSTLPTQVTSLAVQGRERTFSCDLVQGFEQSVRIASVLYWTALMSYKPPAVLIFGAFGGICFVFNSINLRCFLLFVCDFILSMRLYLFDRRGFLWIFILLCLFYDTTFACVMLSTLYYIWCPLFLYVIFSTVYAMF